MNELHSFIVLIFKLKIEKKKQKSNILELIFNLSQRFNKLDSLLD